MLFVWLISDVVFELVSPSFVNSINGIYTIFYGFHRKIYDAKFYIQIYWISSWCMDVFLCAYLSILVVHQWVCFVEITNVKFTWCITYHVHQNDFLLEVNSENKSPCNVSKWCYLLIFVCKLLNFYFWFCQFDHLTKTWNLSFLHVFLRK